MGFNDHVDKKSANGSKPAVGKNGGDAAWRGYINVELSAGLKDQFEDWSHTVAPWLTLEEVTASGCVVSVKRDGAASTFIASITQRNPAHVNAGLCITARSKEAGKALFRALFLVSVMGPDPRWEDHAGLADSDRW